LDGDIYFPIQYKEKYATFGSRDSSIGITIDLDKNITIHHDYDSDNDATHGTFVFGNESHVGDMSKVMKNHLLERIERVILDHRVAVIKEEMNVE
jgi:hypothetical protein